MEWLSSISFWAVVAALIWLTGVLCAFRALMHTRSERGAAAWCIALLSMPLVAIPFYIVFGRRKFSGYRASIQKAIREHYDLVATAREEFAPFTIPLSEDDSPLVAALARINHWKFSLGNRIELLIDGADTFRAILEAIEEAQEYIFIQFYIVRADRIGHRVQRALISKAKSGVRVCFLYDEIGSHGISQTYLGELAAGGVEVAAFGTTRGRANRFQVNFRNHRKIVVTDGKFAFIGGHNIADEYLGDSPKFGHWRDTHVRIEGPAALECQAAFLMDWYWATTRIPEVVTLPEPVADGSPALIMPSGPTSDFEICRLIYHALITNARERIWISTPYLVPDEATFVALQTAAKRGVDVRIMIPRKRDHLIVHLASYSYFAEMEQSGIQILRYAPGFLHQKSILIDDQIAGVGTVNLDQRSFLLNFEIMAFSTDPKFVSSVDDTFEEDFLNCTPATAATYHTRSLAFRIAVRSARLFSPIL